MSEAVIIKEPEPREKILSIIYDILDEFSISPNAEKKFEDLVTKGMHKVDLDRDTQARSLEAQENFRLLAEDIRNELRSKKAIVEEDDIEKSLTSLCPIYPIC